MRRLSNDQGFTLLEVLVATAILAMALAVLFPIFGRSPGRLNDAKEAAVVIQLAAAQLESEILKADWSGLPKSDVFDKWTWEVSGVPYDGADIEGETSYPLHIAVRVWRTDAPSRILASLDRIVWANN